MSTLHLRQICNYLSQNYFSHIEFNEDESTRSEDDLESLKFTRSLVGISVSMLTGAAPLNACGSITDGYNDNGIDGIYYNDSEKCLYLIQSKYHKDGNGSIDVGDLHKFIQGTKDLVNTRYEKFNEKIMSRSNEIEEYLLDAKTKFSLIIVHSGKDQISSHCKALVDEFLDEYNDISEIFTFSTINQKQMHSFISVGADGSPINIDALLHNWCDIKEPLPAFYGQIAASDLSNWYEENGRQLFSPNIRVYLGETEVNEGITETVGENPEYFWYFNNGITALCDSVKKKPIGGTGHDTGIFECVNLKIVNGAQTVGTLHSLSRREAESLEKTRVWIRIISLENADESLSKTITRTNNTQNRIEKRDFVALDPEQKRLHDELNLEQIHYLYKSGELRSGEEEGFDLTEATVARACIQTDIQHAVQAKREISKLWDDIEKAPYKILFNSGLQGPRLWKEIRILRFVEQFVSECKREYQDRDKLMITHGNRFLLHLVYQALGERTYDDSTFPTAEEVFEMCQGQFEKLKIAIDENYSDSILGSLFKNLSKCKDIKSKL